MLHISDVKVTDFANFKSKPMDLVRRKGGELHANEALSVSRSLEITQNSNKI